MTSGGFTDPADGSGGLPAGLPEGPMTADLAARPSACPPRTPAPSSPCLAIPPLPCCLLKVA